MKLIVATIQDQDADRVVGELTTQHFGVTRIGSTGGFLQQGNTTLLLGVEDEQVDAIIKLLERDSQRRKKFLPIAGAASASGVPLYNYIEVEVGGATVFVLNVEHFEQL